MSENHTDRGRFSGRVAVVTGASRGIGLAFAERLVAEGARVRHGAQEASPTCWSVVASASSVVAAPGRRCRRRRTT